MQSLAQIRQLLAERGLRPKRSLGQNFLIDQNLVAKLVQACDVAPGQRVLEVGPGTGTLTEALLDAGASVLACELDDGLYGLLADRLGDRPGLTLVHGDCLHDKRTLHERVRAWAEQGPFALVANLPYGCATPLLSTLLLHWPACTRMGVTVQKEVGDRLLAQPGSKPYGPLSVLAQAACQVRAVASLPPACFWPRPQVDSVMVLLCRRPEPMGDLHALSEVCQALFRQRRKRLAKPLAELLGGDPPPGLDPDARAEQLPVEAFVRLADQLLAKRRASSAMRRP